MTVVNGCELRFGLLGPLEVCVADQNVEIGSSKRRIVLATLLLNANRPVTLDRLIEAVWPATPPRSAIGNLHTYVSDLRRCLSAKEARITTRSSGYSITVRPHELDLLTFDELMARGARLWDEEHPAEALDLLQQALALWRGEPLEGLLAGPTWEADLGRLAERRLAAQEERLALLVELGNYATAISEARAMLHGQPFREKVWRLLMLALNYSGRRAEALQAYVDVRGRLVEELGVEPGPELRRTHAAILADNASAHEPEKMPAHAPGIPAEVSPLCQLPPDIPDFTGRVESVQELTRMLSGGDGTGKDAGSADQGLATAVIVGPPGMGKSALAVHVAHLVRVAFPDGQLYADLGGTTRSPREPGELLAEALRALGVTGAAIPASLCERAALYRTRLADRRVLVVLDNAATAAQVQPLSPATAGCAVIVTSRHRLGELPGAYPVVLDALGPEEAQELIGRIVGRDRIEREPKEAAAIVSECAYLPLAIRIAGAKLAGRKAWTLKVLRQRLADESRRISELQVGDLGVRTGFAMSMRMLPPDAARAFRLLGMLGAQTFPGWVIDAMLDRRHHTDDVLDALLDAHMLQSVDVDAAGQPRYWLHDLLRAYAREAAVDDPPELRRAALTRVLGGWLALADQAADRLPATANRTAPGHAPRWRLDSRVAAQLTKNPRAWFEAERRSLLTGVALAAESGLDGLAWELAACLVPYLDHT
jgi:DNA-binding SARP family transcriptional activator